MIIDLHMHSNVSDGSLPPRELVALAKESGVSLMALTDHDTMAGVPEAAEAARSAGIGFVPGVEISTAWGGQTVHIVGLGLDADDAEAERFFAGASTLRDKRGQRIAEKFEKLYGIRGSYEGALSFAGNRENLSRTHFARWLLREGIVKTYQEAFDRFLRTGRPCFVQTDWPSVAEAVAIIHRTGGLAVIAHPGRYHFDSEWMSDELCRDFRRMGGDAIEVSSGSQSPAADLHFAQVARDLGFLASAGSDWHSPGGTRPAPGHQAPIPDDLTPVWDKLRIGR